MKDKAWFTRVYMRSFCTGWLGHEYEDVEEYFHNLFNKEGIPYKLSDVMPNTLNAHRLLHYAEKYGKQNDTSEVLFRMYWCEGKDIGALEILVAAALEVGLEQSSVTTYLKSSDDSAEIRKREQSWRVSGVPFFMINKQYNESGMQSVKRFEEVFSKIAQQ